MRFLLDGDTNERPTESGVSLNRFNPGPNTFVYDGVEFMLPSPSDQLFYIDGLDIPAQANVEAVLAVLRRYRGVVPGVGTHIAVVVRAAVSDPDNVPGVAVGKELLVDVVVLDGEGPVDQGLDTLGQGLHDLVDPDVPVRVRFKDQSRGNVVGDHSAGEKEGG